jgi:2-phospho-L-lactate/phosphoenolpyruvate guanylyltransferase
MNDVWALVPVKSFGDAKSRLSAALSPPARRELARTMCEDVLAALSAASGLGGIAVVTTDPAAATLARRYGARVIADGAGDGHTGAVVAGARWLADEGASGMLTMPGDIPRVTMEEVALVLAAHRPAPAFTIVPAHDGRGSNAILVSPPGAVPLAFGDDSFMPHLQASRRCGIEPTVLSLPGIGLDIDHPEDLAQLAGLPITTSTQYLLAEDAWGCGYARTT